MAIDTHVHFWDLRRDFAIGINRRIAGIERDFMPEDLRPVALPLGVDQVVLVQAAADTVETDWMLDLALDCEFVRAVIGWIDVDKVGANKTLARLAARRKFVGVRLMAADESDLDWLTRKTTLAAAADVLDRGLVVELLVRPSQLTIAESFCRSMAGGRINVNHCGRPLVVAKEWAGWADGMARLAAQSNVTCKYSGLIERGGFEWRVEHLVPYVEYLLATFGANRLLFASNWPIINLVGNYLRWWNASHAALEACGVSADEMTAIHGGNAETIYPV